MASVSSGMVLLQMALTWPLANRPIIMGFFTLTRDSNIVVRFR